MCSSGDEDKKSGPEKTKHIIGSMRGDSGPLGYMAGVVYEGCEGGIGQDESR